MKLLNKVWLTFFFTICIFYLNACENIVKKELEYWSIGGAADSDYNASELFNSKSEFIVKTISIPWTEHEKKILTSILSGNPPDVISEFAPLKLWASRSSLVALDQYIEVDNFDSSKFFEALWDEMKWEGKTYGIPVNTVSYAFFYNQDIFNELGITSLPKTWDQVRKLSKKIVRFDKNGFLDRVGYLPNYGNLRTSNVIAWQLGQKFIYEDGTVNFSSNELEESFSWVKGFIDEIGLDNVLQLMGTFGVADQHGFISGKVAMMILDSSFPEIISKYNPDLNYKVIPIPSFKGSKTVSSAGTWWVGIPKGAKNPRQSWEFIKFISDKKNQIDYLNKTEESLLSANKDVALMRQSKEMPFGDIFISQLQNSKSPSIIPLAHDKFWEEYDRAEERILRNTGVISEILSNAETQIQLELNKSKRYYEYVIKNKDK